MREYVEVQRGSWDHASQRRTHAERFDPTTFQVVLVNGEAAGVLEVLRHDAHVQLETLYLARAYQRRGVDALLLAQALEDAGEQPVRLRTLRVNTGAQRFYARHTPGSLMMETSRLLAFIPALLIFGCAFSSLVLLGRRRTRVSATFALLTMLGSLPVLVVWTLWSPFLAPFTFASVFGCMDLAARRSPEAHQAESQRRAISPIFKAQTPRTRSAPPPPVPIPNARPRN